MYGCKSAKDFSNKKAEEKSSAQINWFVAKLKF